MYDIGFYYFFGLFFLAVFKEETTIAINSSASFIKTSNWEFSFLLIFSISDNSSKKYLLSSTSSTIFNLLMKSLEDLALCTAL